MSKVLSKRDDAEMGKRSRAPGYSHGSVHDALCCEYEGGPSAYSFRNHAGRHVFQNVVVRSTRFHNCREVIMPDNDGQNRRHASCSDLGIRRGHRPGRASCHRSYKFKSAGELPVQAGDKRGVSVYCSCGLAIYRGLCERGANCGNASIPRFYSIPRPGNTFDYRGWIDDRGGVRRSDCDTREYEKERKHG